MKHLFLSLLIAAQTAITPPENKYSPADDVKLGLDAKAEAEQQLPVMRDDEVTSYIDAVGKRLVASIPPDLRHPEFRYTFQAVNVRDINASLPYYHFVYGKDVDGAREKNPDRLWLNLKNETRIGLQQAPAGQSPKIEHFCIKVRPFDRDAVTAGLKKIGAEVLPSADERGIIRFLDNNRIMVELKAL